MMLRWINGAGALFVSLLSWVERILSDIIIVVLSIMMIVTVVDVVGRYFFNAPLPASFEGTEILLATLIFSALPLVSIRGEHITIDIIDRVVPMRWRSAHRAAVEVLAACVFIVIAWVVWRNAGRIAAAGLHTDILAIPLAPLAYFISIMVALSSAATLIRALRGLSGHEAGIG
jgi:TRAP-type C4-dicarboxylate transport system permease small subunit